MGIQKTTVFNIVKTLTHLGWMIQDTPNGRYRLGPRILRVSTMVTRSISVEDLILREMHRLRNLYNEDVVLTAMIDNVPICVEKVQSANMLRIQSKVGRVSSLVRGSTGKTLFAWQTNSFIEATLEQTFPILQRGTRNVRGCGRNWNSSEPKGSVLPSQSRTKEWPLSPRLSGEAMGSPAILWPW